ncbi:MAG: endonuclease/exonuclease/phosphatase family protein [Puniceicoccales bacterium]|nr:endonuclease/exonuclease/phosphatase family protein [Puniceicoccales bacterium]
MTFRLPNIRFLIFAFAVSFLTPQKLPAERLRVATYNVQNYTLENRRIESTGKNMQNYPKPEKEKAALRLVVHAINADILALQEIGGQEFVNELCHDLSREGLHYPHTISLEGPDKKREIAILSKKPFNKIIPHSQIPLPATEKEENFVSRGLLGASFKTPSGIIHIYTLHLKSRYSRDKEDPNSNKRRLAEANAISNLIRDSHAADPNALVILCGDFNDLPNSTPLRRFSEWKRSPPLAPLPAADSRGETWTYRNKRNDYYSRSDYFFLSPPLKKHLRAPARIADIPATFFASDHRPLWVDLDL